MACSSAKASEEDEKHAQLDEGGDFGDWDQPCTSMIWDAANREEEDDPEMEEITDGQSNERRKSCRKRTQKRPFSPEKIGHKKPKVKLKTGLTVKTKKVTPARRSQSDYLPDRPFDRLANGSPFCCDLCKSPYVCNRYKQGQPVRRSKHMPSPRHKLDPLTGRVLRLCNPCGLAFDRSLRPRKVRALPPPEDKEKYMEDAKQFGQRLSANLGDPDAEKLFCPNFKFKACGCIQSYILFEGNQEHSNARAQKLLSLLKEAQELTKLSFADEAKKTGKSHGFGLGTGKKKSKQYEDFVMEKRQYLKETVKLCERAVQRVLMYSNNFIHKKLKSEDSNCRAQRVIGKAALGLLPPLSGLEKKKCCTDNCVMVAATHSRLLQEWRDRAKQGQTEARRVLGEMLTPSGGARTNCYKFISMVTGCSLSLIGCVNDQMRRTGGDRKPPTHGLKKYWEANQRHVKNMTIADGEQGNGIAGSHNQGNPPSSSVATMSSPEDAGSMDAGVNSTSYQFELQRQQLLQLQRQLTEQQTQLQQHQQLVQQSLLQQSLLQQLAESGAQVIQTQPGSLGNIQTTTTTGPGGLASGVQPIIVSSNQLSSLETSPTVPILQQIQAPFSNGQTTQQTILPSHSQATQQNNAIINVPSISQQQQPPQQPMQTVQVMIANIELPSSQQNQGTLQIIAQPQQQQQHSQQNTMLQSQHQHHQPQQAHILQPEQQQHPGQLLTSQRQQQNALAAQTLSMPQTQGLTVQLRPSDDHTYSQLQPRPTHIALQQHPPPLTQAPFQLQVVPQQPPSIDGASSSVTNPATRASNSGYFPQTTTQTSSSPLQMLASFTAEPFDAGQAARPARGQWASEIPSVAAAAASVSPTFGLATNNCLQSQTLTSGAPLNLQTLQQIFSIVNVSGVSGLCPSSLASDSSSNVSSPTKQGQSPTVHLEMISSSSSQSGIQSTNTDTTSAVDPDREMNCSVFMQQAHLTDNSCLTQPEQSVTSSVGELQEDNSPDTQESHSGEVTSSPLSSEMMSLLSESCD